MQVNLAIHGQPALSGGVFSGRPAVRVFNGDPDKEGISSVMEDVPLTFGSIGGTVLIDHPIPGDLEVGVFGIDILGIP